MAERDWWSVQDGKTAVERDGERWDGMKKRAAVLREDTKKNSLKETDKETERGSEFFFPSTLLPSAKPVWIRPNVKCHSTDSHLPWSDSHLSLFPSLSLSLPLSTPVFSFYNHRGQWGHLVSSSDFPPFILHPPFFSLLCSFRKEKKEKKRPTVIARPKLWFDLQPTCASVLSFLCVCSTVMCLKRLWKKDLWALVILSLVEYRTYIIYTIYIYYWVKWLVCWWSFRPRLTNVCYPWLRPPRRYYIYIMSLLTSVQKYVLTKIV